MCPFLRPKACDIAKFVGSSDSCVLYQPGRLRCRDRGNSRGLIANRPSVPSYVLKRQVAETVCNMAVGVLCLSLVACTRDARPVVFNRVSELSPTGGNLAREHFAKLYRIIDVDDRKHKYTPPKYLAGLERPQPAYGQNHCLPENAWVLFVVTTEGVVTFPQVIQTSATLPSKLAIEKVQKMRFQPATLDGKPVPAVADFHFALNCSTVYGDHP